MHKTIDREDALKLLGYIMMTSDVLSDERLHQVWECIKASLEEKKCCSHCQYFRNCNQAAVKG